MGLGGVGRGDQRRNLLGGALEPLLVDARQELRQALVKAGGQHGLRGHDIDPLQRGETRQQVEVGRPQPVRVVRVVRNGGDNMDQRPGETLVDGTAAQAVLVQPAGPGHALLKRPKRGCEKACLPQQPARPAIDLGAGLEIGGD